MPRIREASSADIPAMHHIRLSVRENRLTDASWLTPAVYEACLKAGGTSNTWVAEVDGVVAGFSTARTVEQDIWALFVDPAYEGHGLGRALLDAAVGWLFARGVAEVVLSTGPDTRADAFYRRAGWRRGETLDSGDVRYRLARGDTATVPNRISPMLKIDNLHVRVAGKDILKGLSLHLAAGMVHAVMGPNGAGKSTLGNVLAGREGYEVVDGSVEFEGRDLLELAPEERAAAGVFLAFQYPVEIPGVNNTYFLRAALNAQRKARGEPELDSMQFLKRVREKLAVLHLKDELLHRAVNEGFSGGEKKRNEIFQLALLEPKLAILDETDSGLDIDALKAVADGVNALRSPDRAFLVITHYQRLLDYIRPDVVHVLAEGRIVETGGPELALELEQHGYSWLRDRIAPGAAA